MASQIWASDLWFLDYGNIQTNNYRMDRTQRTTDTEDENQLFLYWLIQSVSLQIQVNSSNQHCSVHFCLLSWLFHNALSLTGLWKLPGI